MALNEKPCRSCVHFDQIALGDGTKKARHGWCSVRSEYPAQEQPGQVFPIGVKRVPEGQLAKPYIVTADGVVGHCTLIQEKVTLPTGPRPPLPPPVPWKRTP